MATVNTAPVVFSPMGANDLDGAFELDCTANMTTRGDTIASVGVPTIERTDGAPLGATDILVLQQSVDSTGLLVTWLIQARGAEATYLIGFPLTLASGNVLVRWVQVSTVELL